MTAPARRLLAALTRPPTPTDREHHRRTAASRRATAGDRRISRCPGCGGWCYVGWCRTCEPSTLDLGRRSR